MSYEAFMCQEIELYYSLGCSKIVFVLITQYCDKLQKITISHRSFRKNIKCIKLTCCWVVSPEYLFQLTLSILAVTPHS